MPPYQIAGQLREVTPGFRTGRSAGITLMRRRDHDEQDKAIFCRFQGESCLGSPEGGSDASAAGGQTGVHQTMIATWRKQAVDAMASVFSGKSALYARRPISLK